MGSTSAGRCGFVKGMAERGHIHAHIEQDIEGNGYVWSVTTAEDIWMGVAANVEQARAIVNAHVSGLIHGRRR